MSDSKEVISPVEEACPPLISDCENLVRVQLPRNNRGKKPYVRKYFDLWSRRESDSLKSKLLGHLGYSGVGDSFSTLLALPEVSWDDDSDIDSKLRLVQARALFTKDADMVSPVDKEKVALDAFLQSEASCKRVNDEFRDGTLFQSNGSLSMILYYAKEKVANLIGDCPTLDELTLTFGPGSSTSCRKRTSARWKLSATPSISVSCLNLISELRQPLSRYLELHNNVVRVEVGEVETVPKNYKTDRCICIEPSVNGMIQRGIGKFLKRKLYNAGINLADQTINQRRAAQGSRDGSLCTIDLERASDSIAALLVMDLLPVDWYELMDNARSPVVRYFETVTPKKKKKTGSAVYVELEKFSSMGNGFTFELESMIFYALAYAIARHHGIPFDFTVYGDDIVTTPQLTDLIYEYFPQFGFTVNIAKSYKLGPFRESCGGDFLLGIDVRPFFVKDRFSAHGVVCFYNFLMRKPWFDPSRLLREELLKMIPQHLLLYGPDGFGDGHVISNSPNQDYLKPYGRKKGYNGFTFESWVANPYRDEQPVVGDALVPFYDIANLPNNPLQDAEHCARKEIVRCLHGDLLCTLDKWLLEMRMISRLEYSCEPNDQFVLRTDGRSKTTCRKVKIYVLG